MPFRIVAIFTLFFATSLMAQETPAIPQALREPYPTFQALQDLGTWIQSVEQTAQTSLKEARARRDGTAVSQILLKLDQARAHGYRELSRLQSKAP